ncbi:MAG: diadenylate cyclase CdaA [Finegoldia sp.]|nr:diadenylate cyclase CdaA [Finegoldia sp.]
MNSIVNFLNSIRILDLIDIAIVAFVIYALYNTLKNTRAEQLVKGLVIIFIFTKISELLKLYTVNWVLQKMITGLAFTLIVVFQPELRKILATLGKGNIIRNTFSQFRGEDPDKIIDEILMAAESLSDKKIGALIVFERNTGLNDIVETGTSLNADISYQILMNIFIPNTPLHDGAVVIKNDVIRAAACFLPLSTNENISRELGTRHRAAIGMSERSDSIVLTVSEETGDISISVDGKIHRKLTRDQLKKVLRKIYLDENYYLVEEKSEKDEG